MVSILTDAQIEVNLSRTVSVISRTEAISKRGRYDGSVESYSSRVLPVRISASPLAQGQLHETDCCHAEPVRRLAWIAGSRRIALCGSGVRLLELSSQNEISQDGQQQSCGNQGGLVVRTSEGALLNAGADRVVVRPEHVETEKEMGEQLERMAEAVLR